MNRNGDGGLGDLKESPFFLPVNISGFSRHFSFLWAAIRSAPFREEPSGCFVFRVATQTGERAVKERKQVLGNMYILNAISRGPRTTKSLCAGKDTAVSPLLPDEKKDGNPTHTLHWWLSSEVWFSKYILHPSH